MRRSTFPTMKALTAFLCTATILLPLLSPAQPEVPHLTNDWSFELGPYSDCSPAVGKDGAIYMGTFQRTMWAINSDGSRKWKFTTHGEIRSSPAVTDDGTVFFGCRDRKLYCIDERGKQKWAFETGGWVDSSPALGANGAVCFGSWDKRFYACNGDGAKLWQFETGGPIDSSPAIDQQGRICFGSHDHKFYMLSPDGKKLWGYPTGGAIISSPALERDGVIYFTSVDGFFYALNADGSLRWRLHTGGVTESSPIIGLEGVLYVGVNKNLWAITPEGKKKWEQPATGDSFQEPIYATPVAMADGTILLISGYGLLQALQPDRSAKWFFRPAGHGHGTPGVAANGTVYINKYETMFALRATIPLADTPWPTFRRDSQRTGRVR